MLKNTKQSKRQIRHKRVRMKIKGTAERPRLSVFKSNYHLYVQLINDKDGKTLVAVSDKKTSAYEVGKLIAKKSAAKKITNVVFDRGGYKYHGIILELAKGAREGGLKF